ncbi:MAG: Cysteine--tRNA ligase [Bacteroidota bacterium]
MGSLKLYNSLSRDKEIFQPINAPFVGLYVCGPTVYNYVHLGNVRTFTSFDILFRYLKHLGYQVRYVRNITDVGHLTDDNDDGEDKIGKMAKLEKIEPMEIVNRYTQDFHQVLSTFNILPPSIEPTATGHIIEQIEAAKTLIEKGLAYESNGSVYFNIQKFNENGGDYGKLSGRILDELLTETRELDGIGEKKSPLDFALWKKASPEHIMRWNSPWGPGFPGWHLECTCMSNKYLGNKFDIHGGGMDLKFPHHECEIAQAKGAFGESPANIWMHTNMLTVNGQKMSKSLGNSFLPGELFTGNHPLLDQAYSPMSVRFFMLQSHYRSTLDFSNDALKASQKGYKRLSNGIKILKNIHIPENLEISLEEKHIQEIEKAIDGAYEGMNDDLNTAVAISHLFTLLKKINQLHTKQLKIENIGIDIFEKLKSTYFSFYHDILGLKEEIPGNWEPLSEQLLIFYKEYKENKDYSKVDEIRASFKKMGILIKDMKDSIDWGFEE